MAKVDPKFLKELDIEKQEDINETIYKICFIPKTISNGLLVKVSGTMNKKGIEYIYVSPIKYLGSNKYKLQLFNSLRFLLKLRDFFYNLPYFRDWYECNWNSPNIDLMENYFSNFKTGISYFSENNYCADSDGYVFHFDVWINIILFIKKSDFKNIIKPTYHLPCFELCMPIETFSKSVNKL